MLACAIALGSCGDDNGGGGKAAAPTTAGGDSQAIRAEVQRVWNDVYAASRVGDGQRACRHATANYVRDLMASAQAKTCEKAVRSASKLLKKLPAGAHPKYSSFSTTGQTARIRATLTTNEGPFKNDVTFRYVDDQWKVDGESGTG
jgi:hypothetical protein